MALLAAVAAADNDPAAEVKRLAAEGKTVEAARFAGTWLADAQKRGNLLEEESAWKALRDVPLSSDAYRDACAEIMKSLDPKRNGAYLSANLLALELVRFSIRNNDDRHLADAAAVLAKHARGSGSFGSSLAHLAEGVAAARRGEKDAVRPLKDVFEWALLNGWLELAIQAGTEIACEEKKAGRDRDTLARLDKALKENGDRALLQLRRALAEARIPERTIELDPGSVSAKGGRGGKGGATESAVGAAWKTFPDSKPLLTVERGESGFEIKPRFAGTPKAQQALGSGVRYWDGGGITLSFHGPGVALAMVDLTGRRGQPGESSQPQPWQFFYLLADGETWSVTKEGVVSIGN